MVITILQILRSKFSFPFKISWISLANKQQYDFYWPSPVKPGGDHFDYEYENKLVEDWGIPKDFVIYKMWTATKKECPILCGLADKLGLEDAQVNIQTQTTGMMLHLHIDSLTGLRKERQDQSSSRATDPEWGRVFVMLEDWKPGHIIQFGNTYVPPWKAGDVVWFDWANIPHSTANTGPWPRTIASYLGNSYLLLQYYYLVLQVIKEYNTAYHYL